MEFLSDYLPDALGINQHVPPLLIKKQIGSNYSAMIFTEERDRDSRRLGTRVKFLLGLGLLHFYYFVRNLFFRRFDTLAGFMGSVFSQAGEELINSWRSAYDRRPFYVPANASTWLRSHGADEGFKNRLRAWRHKLFYTLAAGIGFLVASTLFIVITLALIILGQEAAAKIGGGVTLGSFLIAIFILKVGLPRISRRRPRPTD